MIVYTKKTVKFLFLFPMIAASHNRQKKGKEVFPFTFLTGIKQ